MASIDNTLNYYLNDFPKAIFPLDTNKIIIENAAQKIHDYIYKKVLDDNEPEHHFLPQMKCHASKHGLHLRRTFKLDPVSEFYIYDLIYRNRTSFRKDFSNHRKSYGHRFENGNPIPLGRAYREFKQQAIDYKAMYKHALKIDLSSYFNNIYHHDIIKWFSIGRVNEDILGLGQFLREINSGRSVDCLPQGLHPCKVIGAEFLKFIDDHRFLKSERLLRFMDDIFLFSDSEEVIRKDFILIQQLAGEKGLNFNSAKTLIDNDVLNSVSSDIEKIRSELITFQTEIIETYDGIEEVECEATFSLNPAQIDYLYELLRDPNLDEHDAELILTFMIEYGDEVLGHLSNFLEKFPNLSRRVYYFCRHINDLVGLSDLITNKLSDGGLLTEEQLFWFGKITETYLKNTNKYSDILINLYEHKYATTLSKCKILEMDEQRFGINDIREEFLRVGRSDWLSWSSAVGTRGLSRNNRNHILNYFKNGSPMNYIIADTMISILP